MTQIEGWLRSYLPGRGRLALDVGANSGSYTEWFSDHFDAVHAFEPNPDALAVLHANVGDRDNVEIFETAVGAAAGELVLNLYPEHSQATAFTPDVLDTLPRGHSNGSVTVPLTSLDELGYQERPVEFVKIDVEGYECEVLRGAEATLWEYHPALLIEIHSQANAEHAVQLLTGLGYTLERIPHPHLGVPAGHHWIYAR